MITGIAVHTNILTNFDDLTNRWHGTSNIRIEVVDTDLGTQVEEFTSDEIVSEDINLLLEQATDSLNKAVDMSNLLDGVDFGGEEDLTGDLT